MKKNLWGFTLAEVIVVIVVIAVMAGLAVPVFITQIQMVKNREAEQILLSVYGAQLEYSHENDDGDPTTTDYADDIKDLDIKIEADNIGNFMDLTARNTVAGACFGAGEEVVAHITDKNETFILYIQENATIGCSTVDDFCDGSALCTRMGY